MKRTSAKGRLGLLAAPLVLAALPLALSACVSPAPGGGSGPGKTSAPASSPAPGSTSAPASSPAPGNSSAGSSPAASGNSAPSPNIAQFCLTWQLTAPYFSKDFAVLGNDPGYDMSTPAVFWKIASVAIGADLRTAYQAAPAAVSADMNTLMNYWNAIYADLKYETSINLNVTVAQVKAYIQAHPPAQTAEVGAAVQDLSGFLAANCTVNISS